MNTDHLKRLKLQFKFRMTSFHKNRRLGMTEDGTVFLGPEYSRENDIVVGLYTGKTPFVIRPWGEEYLMLGPCLLYDQKPMDDHRYQPSSSRKVELFEIL